ncbi:MAG: RCC1 repeat-containing protein, partial [bacterium]
AVGYMHSCARMADGTARCWGYGQIGQLGDGTNATYRTTAVVVLGIDGIAAATTAQAITAGSDHTCALMADGTVLCWGQNDKGQVGNGLAGGNYNTPQPVKGIVPGNPAVAISAGANHTCVLMAEGNMRCWGGYTFGSGDGGQLGDGSIIDSPRPVGVDAPPIGR